MTAEAFTVVYNKALDLVSRREHSRHELMQKLKRRLEIKMQERVLLEVKKENSTIQLNYVPYS